ncbi:hypothetical protein LQL77_31670, partial [Rhodococcus cerastii]|nr:hypothetical protein [Rhodococcus cerastii]
IEIYNPFLIPNTDIRVHMNFHPAPTPDPVTCPTPTTAADTSADVDAGTPTPGEPTAPAQADEEWKDFFFPERYTNRQAACRKAQESGARAILTLDHNGQGERFYVLKPRVSGGVIFPPSDDDEWFVMMSYGNRHDLEIVALDMSAENGPAYAGERLAYESVVHGIVRERRLWVVDHSWQAPAPDPTGEDAGTVPVPEPTDGGFSTAGGSCDPDTDLCVLEVAGPPNQKGAIPLTLHALHPREYPDVDVAAPATPTKNLVVVAPPAETGITSVTVTTRREHTTVPATYTLAPGHAREIPRDETLTSTRANTH